MYLRTMSKKTLKGALGHAFPQPVTALQPTSYRHARPTLLAHLLPDDPARGNARTTLCPKRFHTLLSLDPPKRPRRLLPYTPPSKTRNPNSEMKPPVQGSLVFLTPTRYCPSLHRIPTPHRLHCHFTSLGFRVCLCETGGDGQEAYGDALQCS